MLQVVLAEHHEMMRRTLRLVLEAEGGIEVSAEAADLPTAVRDVYRLRPDVLVLDLRLPGGSSLDAIRELRDQAPDIQVVAVTMQDGTAYAKRAVDAGAVGFVLKDMADTDLVPAVRRADRGERFESPRPTW
jgi:two-component system response regulator NreC